MLRRFQSTSGRVREECIRQVTDQLFEISSYGAPLAALFVAALLWPVVPHRNIEIWGVAATFAVLTRAIILRRERKRYRAGHPPVFSYMRSLEATGFGISFGSVALIAFPDKLHVATAMGVGCILVAIMTARVVACSASRTAFVFQTVPIGLQAAIAFLTLGSRLATWIGVALLAYLVVLFRLHRIANRSIVDTISTRFHYEALASQLADEQTTTLGSNAELQRANAEIRRLALTDDLTGLSNRRRFLELLRSELDARRETSVLLIDLDHFKSVNDTYGHSTGDAALKALARAANAAVRPSDTVCRFGGEEFAALLPHTGARDAAIIAERLRASISAMQIESVEGLRLTVSIGVACAPVGGDPDALLALSDQALYAAKNAGRNRVQIAASRRVA